MTPRNGWQALSSWFVLLCFAPTAAWSADVDEAFADAALEFEVGPDRDGLRRDTWYFVGYQALAIGILYAMPESVTNWTAEQKDGYSLSIWWDNATHPQIDSDDFYLNYILHPYWGAAYFVRARERGYNDWQSFGYAALLSSMYEFGAEALFEEPSIQDLIVTPVGGAIVGRYFMGVRDDIRKRDSERGYRSKGDKWLWVATDPLGSLNQQVDRWVGREAELRFSLGYMPAQPTVQGKQERVYGLAFEYRW
jgi:hypothetical protein